MGRESVAGSDATGPGGRARAPVSKALADQLTALLPLLEAVLDLDDERRRVWLAELRRTRPDTAMEIEALLDLERRLDEVGFLRP